MEFATYTAKIELPTSAIDAYECFIDERKLASFTASPASINPSEQSMFSFLDDCVTGKNIVLERGKKIIQTWILTHPSWPESHISEVCLIFEQSSESPQKCSVKLIHSYLPQNMLDYVKQWWDEQIWEQLTFYLTR